MLKIKKNKNKKPNIGGTVDHFAKSIPRSGNVWKKSLGYKH